MKRKSFLGTILPFLILLAILPLILLYFASTITVKELIYKQNYSTIRESAYLIRNIFQADRLLDNEYISSFCKNSVINTNLRVTVMLPNGNVIGDSHKDPKLLENHLYRNEMQEALIGNEGFSERYSSSLSIDMFYFALPILYDNNTIAVIRVSLPFELSKLIIIKSYKRIFLITLIVGILTTLLGFYISGIISKPVKKLVQITHGISSLDFNSLELVEGPFEIYGLSSNLQKMSKNLEKKFNSATRQKEELKAVFSAIVEAIIVLDKNNSIKSINDAAIKLFKVDVKQMLGKSLIQVIRNSDLDDIVKATISQRKGQYRTILIKEQINVKVDDFENQKFTSRDLYLDVNSSIIETKDHDIRIILVLHDITQLKTLERIRKDFVANVSHELKTPVTSIIGFIETLQNGAINNKKDSLEFLQIMQSQSKRLDMIIKDLLSLSALESYENTEIELNNYFLSEIIESALKVCSTIISKKNINIDIRYSNSLEIKVNANLMEQAIINLINNAAKYCPRESSITINGEKYADYTLIRIADNGPGIPLADRSRVFERFYTVDKARSRELGGTGLGLAIVKHIVLAHKGEISLVSSDPKGAEFIIRIPG